MATLYIVGTPIGNLEDFSKRALRILSEVDLILCEDTRVTKKLLDHYNLKTPTLSYHQHSKLQKIDYIIGLLKKGKRLALVSDAGTPGISDPGNQLIGFLVDQFSSFKADKLKNWQAEELKIVPIPGPSAVTAAASVSGFPMDKFLFLGFPPAKKKRKKFFEKIKNSPEPAIFYESPYRIVKTLKELSFFIGEDRRKVVVCRELTKKFETVYRGTVNQALKQLEQDKIKGEFVVIVGGSLEKKQ